MASTRRETSPLESNEGASKVRRRPPAKTPADREKQLIAKAYDLVEKQLDDGSISATVLSQYVKLGTTRERLEQERLMREVDLLAKKAEAMESAKRVEELYEGAIAAMRSYGGHDPVESFDDEDY